MNDRHKNSNKNTELPREIDSSLYDNVLDLIIRKGFVVTMSVQRELGIGSKRAVKILKAMEDEGLIKETVPGLWEVKDPKLKEKHKELGQLAKESLILSKNKFNNDANATEAIPLTKKQFYNLLKIAYLGVWMINGFRIDDIDLDAEELESYIFSFAPQFGYDSFIDAVADADEKHPTCYPSGDFEEKTKIHSYHEFYDNESFWVELTSKLAYRDLRENHSRKELKKMSPEEILELIDEYEEKWQDELETHGITRLGVVKR